MASKAKAEPSLKENINRRLSHPFGSVLDNGESSIEEMISDLEALDSSTEIYGRMTANYGDYVMRSRSPEEILEAGEQIDDSASVWYQERGPALLGSGLTMYWEVLDDSTSDIDEFHIYYNLR